MATIIQTALPRKEPSAHAQKATERRLREQLTFQNKRHYNTSQNTNETLNLETRHFYVDGYV
jgi:hypothetical protein